MALQLGQGIGSHTCERPQASGLKRQKKSSEDLDQCVIQPQCKDLFELVQNPYEAPVTRPAAMQQLRKCSERLNSVVRQSGKLRQRLPAASNGAHEGRFIRRGIEQTDPPDCPACRDADRTMPQRLFHVARLRGGVYQGCQYTGAQE